MALHSESEYEDLLSQWANLESGLGVLLASPEAAQEFTQRVRQYDRWLQTLLRLDTDLSLYLLFQLADNSPVGYSASHSLVCAVLCHLLADPLHLPSTQRDALVRAALTMNVCMTALQDVLAKQVERPNTMQRDAIASHARRGAELLAALGVNDPLWLDAVARHHDEPPAAALTELPPSVALARILRTVDRYAAMISPRQNREGRSPLDSLRAILNASALRRDEVGHALAQAVGLYPPGTYVRLENQEVAVSVARSAMSEQPELVAVVDAQGTPLTPARWLGVGRSTIKGPIATTSLRDTLNHFVILQCAQRARAKAA